MLRESSIQTDSQAPSASVTIDWRHNCQNTLVSRARASSMDATRPAPFINTAPMHHKKNNKLQTIYLNETLQHLFAITNFQ